MYYLKFWFATCDIQISTLDSSLRFYEIFWEWNISEHLGEPSRSPPPKRWFTCMYRLIFYRKRWVMKSNASMQSSRRVWTTTNPRIKRPKNPWSRLQPSREKISSWNSANSSTSMLCRRTNCFRIICGCLSGGQVHNCKIFSNMKANSSSFCSRYEILKQLISTPSVFSSPVF